MTNQDEDTLQRFIFEKYHVRGAIIHLKATYQKACENSLYGEATKKHLGEAFCAAGLLSSTLKYEGKLTLQLESESALRLLLAQSDDQLHLRGLAMEQEGVSQDLEKSAKGGHLLINIDPEGGKNHYQAVTELQGNKLANTIEHYFEQSEQLPTKLWLFANEEKAAGILLQTMPGQGDNELFWEHLATLTETITAQELLSLSNLEILHRLFHEEEVKLFESDPVCFACTCSKEKMDNALLQIGQQDIEELLEERGNIEVTCEFCNRQYKFDKVDVAQIFATGTKAPPSDTTQ